MSHGIVSHLAMSEKMGAVIFCGHLEHKGGFYRNDFDNFI
jgi:hypothetical protein